MPYYDPKRYWEDRKDPSSKTARSLEEMENQVRFVFDRIVGKDKVLDYGCGDGRLASAFMGCKVVVGVDLIEKYKDEWVKAMSVRKIPNVFVRIDESDILPFPDKHFEVAVAAEVFLHILPTHIERTMGELARVADEVVVISLFKKPFTDWGMPTKQYCHRYDYPTLCKDLGLVVTTQVVRDYQIRFVYEEWA